MTTPPDHSRSPHARYPVSRRSYLILCTRSKAHGKPAMGSSHQPASIHRDFVSEIPGDRFRHPRNAHRNPH